MGFQKLGLLSGSPVIHNYTIIQLVYTIIHRTVEKEGDRGGKRSRARAPKGPVNILRKIILLLLYISAVHFYGISSALKGYLQELSTLMTVLTSETKPSY